MDTNVLAQDKFQLAHIFVPGTGAHGRILMWSVDPEDGTGADVWSHPQREYSVDLLSNSALGGRCRIIGDADHQWLINDGAPSQVFEFNGSKFIERSSLPLDLNRRIQPVFVFNGQLTCVVEAAFGQRELYQLVDGHWKSLGEIELLDTDRNWTSESGDALVEASPSPLLSRYWKAKSAALAAVRNTRQFGHSSAGSMRIVSIGPEMHLFWQVDNRILYRRGIDMIPLIPQSQSETSAESSFPVSALEAENATGIAHGWSVVVSELPELDDGIWWPVAVGGEPAVIMSPASHQSSMPVTALRIEDGRWTAFASTTLPFLTIPVQAGSRMDGSMAYLGVKSGIGRSYVLALEPSGFRPTQFHHVTYHPQSISGHFLFPILAVWGVICALILTLVAMFVMRRDSRQFEFGSQMVLTAPLFRRALARAIDMVVIGGSTVGLLWILTVYLKPDWLVFLEAMQARLFDHPSVVLVTRIQIASAIWFGLTILVTIMLQGIYGITPGKWLTGLRTVRTTLRPVGIARSLLRELLFYFDCAALLSWVPGLLFIVFTKNRQRLGDLLAETIVIDTQRTRQDIEGARDA